MATNDAIRFPATKWLLNRIFAFLLYDFVYVLYQTIKQSFECSISRSTTLSPTARATRTTALTLSFDLCIEDNSTNGHIGW